jgi:CDP-diglyceride synthetase
MSAATRVAIRLTITPLLIAGLVALVYIEHGRIRDNPGNMLILPVLIAVVSGAALLELFRMFNIKGLHPAWIAGTLYFLVRILDVIFVIRYRGAQAPGFVTVIVTLGSFAEMIFLLFLLMKLVFFRPIFSIEDAAVSYLAPAYVLLLKFVLDLYNLIPLHVDVGSGARTPAELEDMLKVAHTLGMQSRADSYMYLLLFLFVASKLPDTLGYAVGKTIGKHPMAPILSPKKTWEGGIAGLLGGFLGSAAILFFSPLKLSLGLHPLLLIVLAAAVTISAVIGDLVKSAFKRWAGVKDSGLIPEFGGVLDIIDSFLLSAPTAYLLLSLLPKS